MVPERPLFISGFLLQPQILYDPDHVWQYQVMLITVEGTEGTGKSTLIENLKDQIEGLYLREPGGTSAGEFMRACLKGYPAAGKLNLEPGTVQFILDYMLTLSEPVRGFIVDVVDGNEASTADLDLTAEDELMLFNIARMELMEKRVRPAIIDGRNVILDRFTDSTVAYQGYGRGLSLGLVSQVCTRASLNKSPDVTLLLTLNDEERQKRMDRRGRPDRIEQSDEQFFERVRKGYEAIAKLDRVVEVDASGTPDQVLGRALKAIRFSAYGSK